MESCTVRPCNLNWSLEKDFSQYLRVYSKALASIDSIALLCSAQLRNYLSPKPFQKLSDNKKLLPTIADFGYKHLSSCFAASQGLLCENCGSLTAQSRGGKLDLGTVGANCGHTCRNSGGGGGCRAVRSARASGEVYTFSVHYLFIVRTNIIVLIFWKSTESI